MTLNEHNLRAVLEVIAKKAEYGLSELDRHSSEKTKREKSDSKAAVEYLKARARKEYSDSGGRMALENNNAQLINNMRTHFQGLWGKNVIAGYFDSIAKEDKSFSCIRRGKSVYLEYRGNEERTAARTEVEQGRQ